MIYDLKHVLFPLSLYMYIDIGYGTNIENKECN